MLWEFSMFCGEAGRVGEWLTRERAASWRRDPGGGAPAVSGFTRGRAGAVRPVAGARRREGGEGGRVRRQQRARRRPVERGGATDRQ